MNKWLMGGLAAVVISSGLSASWAAETPKPATKAAAMAEEKYLQPVEFEKITGLKVAKVVPRNAVLGASGQVNFLDKDNNVIFVSTFETISQAAFKKNKASGVWTSIFNGPIKGVGDEAYTGPKAGEQFILVFLKGTNWVTLSSALNSKTLKPQLSMKQLKELAAVILPRLK